MVNIISLVLSAAGLVKQASNGDSYLSIDFGPFNFQVNKQTGSILMMWTKGDGTYPTRTI